MKIWLINTDDGDTYTLRGDENLLEDSYVATELSYLDGGYEDERDEFIADVERAVRRGRGSARIEERFDVELRDL